MGLRLHCEWVHSLSDSGRWGFLMPIRIRCFPCIRSLQLLTVRFHQVIRRHVATAGDPFLCQAYPDAIVCGGAYV